jgi:hypothetical protein
VSARIYRGFQWDPDLKKPGPRLCANDYRHACKVCGKEFVDQTWCTKRCEECRKKRRQGSLE